MEELAIYHWNEVMIGLFREKKESGAPMIQCLHENDELREQALDVRTALIANAKSRAGLTMEGLLEFDREEEMVAAAEITWNYFLTLRNLAGDEDPDTVRGNLAIRAAVLNKVAWSIWGSAVAHA